MKILFLTGHLAKERNPLLHQLASDFAHYGADVTVVTGYPSRRITDEVRKRYASTPVEVDPSGYKVVRVGSKRGEGNGLLVRFINYIFLTVSIFRASRKLDYDAVYIYSTPPFLGMLSPFFSRRSAVLYNAQDLFPDTLMELKGYSEKNLLSRIFRRFEKLVYDSCDKIVTISEDMKTTVVKNGAEPDKVSVVHNWVDVEKIRPVSRADNILFEKYKLDPSFFYVSYAGNVGLFQNLGLLLDAAKDIKDSFPGVRFVIFGDGAWRQEMERRVERENIDNVMILPLQDQSLIADVYSFGDLELVSIAKGVTKTALPSKTWQIMAAGRPILAMVDHDSEISRIVSDNSLGVVASLSDKGDLRDKIISYYEDPELCRRHGENAREYVVLNNSRKVCTSRYYEELSSMAHAKKGGMPDEKTV